MNFVAKQLNQYETASEIFSQARLAQDINLEKAEKALKVSKKYLLALERGDYQTLPSAIYTKNFARAYAKYLELDEKKIVEIITRELEIMEQVNRRAPQTDPQYFENKILITPKTIRRSIIFLAIVVCLSYLSWQVNAIFSAPSLNVTSPKADLVTGENSVMVEGQTAPEVNVTVNGQEILADQTGHFAKLLDLQTGVNTIKVTAQKKRGRQSTVIRQVMVERLDIIETTNPPMVNTNQPAATPVNANTNVVPNLNSN